MYLSSIGFQIGLASSYSNFSSSLVFFLWSDKTAGLYNLSIFLFLWGILTPFACVCAYKENTIG